MIYFMQNIETQKIKIGYSSKPYQRLKSLQTANPQKLILLGVFPGDKTTEIELHQRFKQYQYMGEWFEPNAELLDFIHNNCLGITKNKVYRKANGAFEILLPNRVELTQQQWNSLFYRVGDRRIKLLTLIEKGRSKDGENQERCFLIGFEGASKDLLRLLEEYEIDQKSLEEFRSLLVV